MSKSTETPFHRGDGLSPVTRESQLWSSLRCGFRGTTYLDNSSWELIRRHFNLSNALFSDVNEQIAAQPPMTQDCELRTEQNRQRKNVRHVLRGVAAVAMVCGGCGRCAREVSTLATPRFGDDSSFVTKSSRTNGHTG